MKSLIFVLSFISILGFSFETDDFYVIEESAFPISNSDIETDDLESDPYPLLGIYDEEEEDPSEPFSSSSMTSIEMEANKMYREMENREYAPSFEDTSKGKLPLYSKPKITQLKPEEQVVEERSEEKREEVKERISEKRVVKEKKKRVYSKPRAVAKKNRSKQARRRVAKVEK